MGETWKCLETQARETLECSRQSSVGNHEDNTEVQNINRNADSKNCSQEALNGNENSVGDWTRAHEFKFWQRTLLSIHALRVCVRLNFKLAN